MKNIFYKLFSISLLGVCLMGCEDETKYLPLPQAVPFTMTVNNTTFVMGEKLVVDLDINPDKDGSEVLANEDFDIYFTAKTGTEDVSGVFKDFHNIVTFPKGEKSIRVEFPLKETGLEGSKNFNFVAFSRGYEIGNPSFPMKVSDYYRVNMAIQGNADNIVTEGDKFVLVASLDKPRAIPIVVSISAKAEDESSFENLPSELTIPAGALNAKTDPISLVMDGAKTGDKELTLNFTSNSEANPMKSDKLVIMMTDLESLANPDMYDPTLVYEHPEYPFVSKGNKSKFDAWWGSDRSSSVEITGKTGAKPGTDYASLTSHPNQKLAEEGGFKEIGSWWETKSSANKERLNSFEIDIVALKSSGKKALIAEVKRMPENNYVHSTFMEKVEHLKHKEMAKYDIETQVLGLEDM